MAENADLFDDAVLDNSTAYKPELSYNLNPLFRPPVNPVCYHPLDYEEAKYLERRVLNDSYQGLHQMSEIHNGETKAVNQGSWRFDKEGPAVLWLLVFRYGECDDQNVEDMLRSPDFDPDTYDLRESQLMNIRDKAMKRTVQEVIGVVARAVRDVGAERWERATINRRMEFFGEIFDELPYTTANRFFHKEGELLDIHGIYSHEDSDICRKCRVWIRHRSIKLMYSAYRYIVLNSKNEEARWAVENDWGEIVRDTDVLNEAQFSPGVLDLPCKGGGVFDKKERKRSRLHASFTDPAYERQMERLMDTI